MRYRVNLVICEGYSSVTRLREARHVPSDVKYVILYFGNFDPNPHKYPCIIWVGWMARKVYEKVKEEIRRLFIEGVKYKEIASRLVL